MTNLKKKHIQVKVGNPIRVKSRYGHMDNIEIKDYVGIDPSDESLDSLIDRLNSFKKTYGSKYTNLTFESEKDCGCYNDCSCSPAFYLHGTRLETDVECLLRVEKEEESNKNSLERERLDYEKLKKKFEKE